MAKSRCSYCGLQFREEYITWELGDASCLWCCVDVKKNTKQKTAQQ